MRFRDGLLALVTVQMALAGAARGARADEGPVPAAAEEDRIHRLERLVEAQGRELERLRHLLGSADASPAVEPGLQAGSHGVGIPTPRPDRGAPRRPTVEVRTAADAGGPTAHVPARPVRPAAAGRSPTADVALADRAWERPAADALESLRWGGYLTLEYVASSHRNSYFDLHRFVLDATAQIGPGIDLSAEIEIEHGGAKDLLDGEVVIEHLHVRFDLCDAFRPKVGAILVPFARFNRYHDDPFNDFTQRPFTARYLVPTGFGQPGIGAEGSLPLGCGHVLSWDGALTSGYEDDFTSSGGVRDARQSWKRDNNEAKQVWSRVAFAAAPGRWTDFLEVGVSGTWSRYDDAGDNDLTGVAVDWLLRKGPFEVQGEYVRYDLERDAADDPLAPRRLDGLWIQAAYHFFPRVLARCRGPLVRDTSAFTLAVRYQHMDLNDRLRGGAFQDDLRAVGIALNYRVTEATVLRVDHTWFDAQRDADRRELTLSLSTRF